MPFEEPKEEWFKDLKKNRKDFKNVQNIIDSAKFKYERDLETPKWVIGTSLAILLAVGFSNVLISENASDYLVFVAKFIIVLTFVALLYGINQIIKLVKIQQKAMIWLYREKDKQNGKRKKNDKNNFRKISS